MRHKKPLETADLLKSLEQIRANYQVVAGRGMARRSTSGTAHYDCVAFSQTDFTDDLKSATIPVLVMHSEDDQIVPYADSGPLSTKLLRNGTLKTYQGFPHGMPTTQAETINTDLLAFIEAYKSAVKATTS